MDTQKIKIRQSKITIFDKSEEEEKIKRNSFLKVVFLFSKPFYAGFCKLELPESVLCP